MVLVGGKKLMGERCPHCPDVQIARQAQNIPKSYVSNSDRCYCRLSFNVRLLFMEKPDFHIKLTHALGTWKCSVKRRFEVCEQWNSMMTSRNRQIFPLQSPKSHNYNQQPQLSGKETLVFVQVLSVRDVASESLSHILHSLGRRVVAENVNMNPFVRCALFLDIS